MSKAMDLNPAVDLVSKLSHRVGQLEQNGFPWQRKDAAFLRDARDHLFAIIMHVRLNGIDEPTPAPSPHHEGETDLSESYSTCPKDIRETAAELVASFGNDPSLLEGAIAAAIDRERGACAQVCLNYPYEWKSVGEMYARLIRKRGEG